MPFLLDDESGQCIVKPEGAEIVAGESLTWYGDTPWPTIVPGRTPLFAGGRDYRYFEERIYEHERLYALGDFTLDPRVGGARPAGATGGPAQRMEAGPGRADGALRP